MIKKKLKYSFFFYSILQVARWDFGQCLIIKKEEHTHSVLNCLNLSSRSVSFLYWYPLLTAPLSSRPSERPLSFLVFTPPLSF